MTIKHALRFFTLLGAACLLTALGPQDDFPQLVGDYLGQKPPGLEPELFAPGIVSTPEATELNAVFSPGGNTFYFTRKAQTPDGINTIMVMERIEGRWTQPRTAPFSGDHAEADPFFAPDGNTLFYISTKPARGRRPYDLLVMHKTETGWSEPVNPGLPLNSPQNDYYPSITSDGVLYFGSNRPGSRGGRDIYKSRYVDGTFTEPQNVGEPVSSDYAEGDVYIAPDERYIIFVCDGRPDGFGSGDLYICFKKTDGAWSSPINMGESVNSESYDFCPIVSPDGKYFFFSRSGDVYWADAKLIDTLRPNDLNGT